MAMGDQPMWRYAVLLRCVVVPPLLCCVLLLSVGSARADVFDYLEALGNRAPVGAPNVAAAGINEGPKGIAAADFDGDGRSELVTSNLDGTVTRLNYAVESEALVVSETVHYATGAQTLRGIATADLSRDGVPDVVAAAPFEGLLHLLVFGEEEEPKTITAWEGVRAVATGDFNGDGKSEIAAAGPNGGLRVYEGDSFSGFSEVARYPDISVEVPVENEEFPGPHYSLISFRRPGALKDSLAVAHALSTQVWVLDPLNQVAAIAFEVRELTAGIIPHALTVANLGEGFIHPALVIASKESNAIAVYSPSNTLGDFLLAEPKLVAIPSGPRAVAAIDTDGDGRSELAIVLRDANKVAVFKTDVAGQLSFSFEVAVGQSPRDLAVADLNGDGLSDLSTINRISEDVTTLLNERDSSGFKQLPGFVSVNGGIADVRLADVNGDAVADTLLLLRDGGLYLIPGGEGTQRGNVEKVEARGFERVEVSQMVAGQFDDDHFADVAIAEFSRSGGFGSIRVLLGSSAGLLEIGSVVLPIEAQGHLLSINAADFDEDGILDLVAGYSGARAAVLLGTGDGSFEFAEAFPFASGARELAVGDFDGDFDSDIAGADYFGEIVWLENRRELGDLAFRKVEPTEVRTDFYSAGRLSLRSPEESEEGAGRSVLMGTRSGLFLFENTFSEARSITPDSDSSIGAFVAGDFNADSYPDVAYVCLPQQCLVVLSGNSDRRYEETFRASVPDTQKLVAGDIDGDGMVDLVGVGEDLWYALSGSMPGDEPRLILPDQRFQSGSIVINEILAKNDSIELPVETGGRPDFVEIFNGSPGALSLSGWKFRLTKLTNEGAPEETWDYVFPDDLVLESAAHQIIVFRAEVETPLHTGFSLPRRSGRIELLDGNGSIIDSVEYSDQEADVSLARVRDGYRQFQPNPSPDPGAANFEIGSATVETQPEITLGRVNQEAFTESHPWQVTAVSSDADGIAAVSLVYQIVGQQVTSVNRLRLVDDGEHGDGLAGDGVYGGMVANPFPVNSEVVFYLEAVDFTGAVSTFPAEASFGEEDDARNHFRAMVSGAELTLEISEAVAANVTGIVDESGSTEDWVEVRNTGATTVSLGGIELTQGLFDTERFYTFPDGALLQPGEHLIVFLDRDPEDGAYHAPFRLSAAGEDLWLRRRNEESRAVQFVSVLQIPPLGADESYARLGDGGVFQIGRPTPWRQNLSDEIELHRDWTDDDQLVLLFRTQPGKVTVLEQWDTNELPFWRSIERIDGKGIEQSRSIPSMGEIYYRVRHE